MGADGVLIGEILMSAPDKNKKISLPPHAGSWSVCE